MTEAAEQKEIDSGRGCFLYSGVASASATAAGGSDLVSIATGVLLLSVSISSSIEWKCYFKFPQVSQCSCKGDSAPGFSSDAASIASSEASTTAVGAFSYKNIMISDDAKKGVGLSSGDHIWTCRPQQMGR